MEMRIIGLLCCSALLWGCTTTNADGERISMFAPQSAGVAAAMNAALPFRGDLSSGETSYGEPIFVQPVSIIEHAVLAETASITTQPILGFEIDIQPDRILYPVYTQKFGKIYCVRTMEGSSGRFSGSYSLGKSRPCLRDSNEDGLFDQFWDTDEAAAEPIYKSVFAAFVRDLDEEEQVAYSLEGGATAPIEIVYLTGAYVDPLLSEPVMNFEWWSVHENNNPVKLEQGNAILSIKKGELPFRIEFMDAVIEINAINTELKKISYKVVSPFTEGKPVLMPSRRDPIVIVY